MLQIITRHCLQLPPQNPISGYIDAVLASQACVGSFYHCLHVFARYTQQIQRLSLASQKWQSSPSASRHQSSPYLARFKCAYICSKQWAWFRGIKSPYSFSTSYYNLTLKSVANVHRFNMHKSNSRRSNSRPFRSSRAAQLFCRSQHCSEFDASPSIKGTGSI